MNSLDNNVRNKVYLELQRVLHTITKANGYTTQPLVCESWLEARDAQESDRIWIMIGSEIFEGANLSNHQTVSLEFIIGAIVKGDGSDVQQMSNALLQDVRNAIGGNRVDIHGNTGAVFVGFDRCETSYSTIEEVEQVDWDQPVAFTYIAGGGSEW
jgi:hypothetical protein